MLSTAVRRLPAPAPERQSPRDDELQLLAYQHLIEHSHFRGRPKSISIEVHRGTLVLEGRLPSFYLKQVLQTALLKVPGIRGIANRVDVVSADSLSSTRRKVQEHTDEQHHSTIIDPTSF